MKYRKFLKGNIDISSLGFGTMRFPTIKNEGDIDIQKTTEMLDYAIYNGLNYIDTAFTYHNGMSENFLGDYLEKRKLRDKIFLATKMPVWKIEKYSDLDYYFNIQLRRLRTSYIDFYLLHSLWQGSWEKVKNLNMLDFLIKKKEEGKIRFFGFSFHDEFNVFKEIIDYYNWDFCQIQLNYMDIDYQAGERGLKYAYEKGIQAIIMEPLKGGKLANPPQSIRNVFDEYKIKKSPVEWALSFLLNKKEILLILSGMSSFEQVKENIEVASKYEINSLNEDELKILSIARNEWLNIKSIGCTNCKYCMPCPNGVNIPKNFEIYNNYIMYGDLNESASEYEYLKEEERASNCRECGTCETLCPQNLEIIKLLKLIDNTFII
ncbi:MAG TPA: aldo/keto reductase [Caldisericia bacterium]|nr:aldo/keto reductase [Caldisericia bacterium]HQL66155.1 aldo/keto reductase [Caldisericia bacterium]HQN48767.1 aldo/keto reductase [Caldisericia bacterium]